MELPSSRMTGRVGNIWSISTPWKAWISAPSRSSNTMELASEQHHNIFLSTPHRGMLSIIISSHAIVMSRASVGSMNVFILNRGRSHRSLKCFKLRHRQTYSASAEDLDVFARYEESIFLQTRCLYLAVSALILFFGTLTQRLALLARAIQAVIECSEVFLSGITSPLLLLPLPLTEVSAHQITLSCW